MSHLTDELQKTNLQRKGIEILTNYFDNDRNIVKSTNEQNSSPDNITNGIIIEKVFMRDNLPVMKLNRYNPGVHYSFLTSEEESQISSCPNCGFTAEGKDFIDGCPYCGTFCNIDYSEKTLGAKYYCDYVMKSSLYIWITLLIDFIVSFGVVFTYVCLTARTFNGYDVMKIGLFTVLLAAVLFVIFYFLDAFVVTLPVQLIKNKQNKRQSEFFENMEAEGVDKSRLLNDFHAILRPKLYADETVIDYDITEFSDFHRVGNSLPIEVSITCDVRVVHDNDGKLSTKNKKQNIIMIWANKGMYNTKAGFNYITCKNCGASIRLTDGKCVHCGAEVTVYHEWEEKNCI